MTRDQMHLLLVFGSVLIGLAAALIVFIVSVAKFAGGADPANTIVAIGGPVYTLIGTLVGYMAGHQLGARGKEQAEEREVKAREAAAQAERDIDSLRGWVRGQPQVLQQARQAYPDMFQ